MENITMDGQALHFIVDTEYDGLRIDKYLSEVQEGISRSYIQKLITEHRVIVNTEVVKASYKVIEGQNITLFMPPLTELNIIGEKIPLDILYEDNDVILVNKGKGMVVHPAAGHMNGTLVNALIYHCKGKLSGINGVMRPGIVHRIDQNTTGILIVCKNDKSHQFISEQLKAHSITRKYNALVYHHIKEIAGRVDAPIGRDPLDRKKMSVNYKNGKWAVTNYQVIENFERDYSHIECSLETGRTHQIRVHMTSINHPLLGDKVYGPAKDIFHLEGQALHARVLGFVHPSTEQYMEFESPLPEYFESLIHSLRNK